MSVDVMMGEWSKDRLFTTTSNSPPSRALSGKWRPDKAFKPRGLELAREMNDAKQASLAGGASSAEADVARDAVFVAEGNSSARSFAASIEEGCNRGDA